MAPIIRILRSEWVGAFWTRDRRAHATAWLAPLPPEPVAKDSERRVSPGLGRRDVRVMRSVFREPIMVIWGVGIITMGFGFWMRGMLECSRGSGRLCFPDGLED